MAAPAPPRAAPPAAQGFPGPSQAAQASFLPAAAPPFEVRALDPGTLATIVYTSGTTGKPKGVQLSHANILANVEASSKVIGLHETDTALSVLPMSHMFERTCGCYLMLYAGVCVAYSRGVQQIGDDLAAVRELVHLLRHRGRHHWGGRLGRCSFLGGI
jgi:long-chain acyl-CoA synthetase